MSNDDPDHFPVENENFEIQQLNEANWFVMNLTTPANLFHALRRQIALHFRKPVGSSVFFFLLNVADLMQQQTAKIESMFPLFLAV